MKALRFPTIFRGFDLKKIAHFFQKNIKITGLFIFLTLIFIGILSFVIFDGDTKAQAASWFNDNWLYRTPYIISNTGTQQTNVKVKLDIDTATLISDGKLQSACQDSRFTDQTGKPLQFHIEDGSSSVAFDGSGATSTSTNVSQSISFSHTVNSGSNRMLAVMIHALNTSAGSNQEYIVQQVTYNSVDMTRQVYHQGTTASRYFDSEIWTLTAPATGSNTLTVTFSSANMEEIVVEAMNFTGVDQYDPVGGRADNVDTTNASVSVTVSTENDSSVIVAGGLRRNDGSPEAPSLTTGTTTYQINTGGTGNQTIYTGGGYQSATTAGPHTVTLGTASDTGYIDLVALEIKANQGRQSTIQFDSKTIYNTGTGTTATNFTHTVNSGSNRLLAVVFHGMEVAPGTDAIDIDISSVKFDGTSLTRRVFVDSSSSDRRSLTEIWTMTAPSIVTGTVSVNATGTSLDNQIISAYNFTGVDQTTSTGASGTASDNSNINILSSNLTTTYANSFIVGGGMRRQSGGGTGGDYDITYINRGNPKYQSKTGIIGNIYMDAAGGYFYSTDAGITETLTMQTTNSTISPNNNMAMLELHTAADPPAISNGCNDSSTDYYVLIPSLLAGNSTIYHYYGNPAVEGGFTGRQFTQSEAATYTATAGTEAKTPGPIAYWKLDDASGTTANDSTLQNNDGTVTNASWATSSSCKFGGCLSFDGTGDYVTRAADTDFDGSGSFTISAWINTSGVGSTQTIASKYESAGGDGGYILRVNPSGTISFGIDDSNANFADDLVTSTSTYNDGTWHQVTGVKNGTTSITLYVDGVLARTDSSIASTGTIANNDAIFLGTALDGTSNPFIGYIDEFKFYKYARSTAEIQTDNISNTSHGTDAILGAADSSTLSTDLVGYWKVDEGYSTNVNDSTSNNNDLTMSASAARWTNSGKFAKAWDGSGPGSNIRMSRADDADFDFDGTANFTVSLWFKSDSSTNPSGDQYLVDKESTNGYAVYADNTGKINFGIDSTGSWTPDDKVTSSSDIFDGSWHYIAAVKTGTSKIELFVDGSLNASNSSLTATGDLSNNDSLTIGDQDTSTGNEFAGDIDEIKIYRAALSASQVRVDFNRGAAISVGSTGSESDGATNGTSAGRAYCVPGDTSSCSAPVGEWLLDENTGTSTTYDTSGNSRNGTLTSITASNWIPGANGGSALTLDGAADYVDIGTGPSTVNSISFWAYPETTTEYFVNLTSTTNYIWLNGGTVTATGLTSPTIYVNGRQTTTMSANAWQYVTVTTSSSVNASNLDIGRTQDANYLQGKIDNVRLYDYVRSPAQVAWEYNKGGPIIWYRFDECQGTRAYNSVRNGNNKAIGFDGTINYVSLLNTSAGTCNSGTSTEMWNNGTTGKINSSLDFDGTDDYVNIPSPSLPTGDFTYAAWVNLDTINDERIFMAADGAGNNELSIDVGSVTNGAVTVDVDGASVDVTSAQTISASTWAHIAVTRIGSSIRIYINGILDSNAGSNGNVLDFSTCDLLIGTDADSLCTGSLGNYLDGRMDDIRIYNYGLTQKQINTVYANGAAVFK